MSASKIKTQMIAEAVNYDISYISKWTGGKILPSRKSISEVAAAVAECVANNVDVSSELYTEYNATSSDELKARISDSIYHAYYESLPKRPGADLSFSAEDSLVNLYAKIEKSFYDDSEVYALLDIFSFGHESRLLFAAMKNGRFTITENRPGKDIIMIVNIPEDSHDPVYDSVFLIHMLTSFSRVNMELYHNSAAAGKLLFAAADCSYGITASALLFEDITKCTAVSVSNDRSIAGTIKETLGRYKKPENSVFVKMTMQGLIEEKDYIKSLLSSNVRWLLGHPTELILPDDVFEELLIDMSESEKTELRRLHVLTQSVIEQPNIFILVYESVLSDLVVSGEIDFFNKPRVLTANQRLSCIRYYGTLADEGRKIKLIDTGFSSDFSNISNPCLLMSDSCCYLRLENGIYCNNILVVKNQNVRNLFNSFFGCAWLDRSDVVLEGPKVGKKIRQYRQAAELLEKIE